MQNILNAQPAASLAPFSVAPFGRVPAPVTLQTLTPVAGEQSASLLQKLLPETASQISQACAGPAELIAYRVRQALNEGLSPLVTQQLLSALNARPVSDQSYTRHILHADPEGLFTVVALVWEPQQSSPVHAHHTWCAYRVVMGVLTESHYEWDATQQKAYLFNKVKRQAGQSVSGNAGLELIHRLGNESAGRAISIHVYGVEAESISTHVNHLVPWSEKI